MPSDIPRARSVLQTIESACEMDANARKGIKLALSLMTRDSPVRRAPTKRVPITDAQKRKVRSLKHTDLTYHDIAIKLGLANGGRVSEIMTGKRK
jgi:hypothetical protein